MAEYTLTKKAKDDLLVIIEYTRIAWGKQQIRVYIDAIEEQCQMLANNPGIGKGADRIALDLLSHPIKSHVIITNVREQTFLLFACFTKGCCLTTTFDLYRLRNSKYTLKHY